MKALKIFGWTLLGFALMVIAVVCIAMYVIFTPARLTPIARQATDRFITCEHEIGEVELTFFATFPRFGLRADGLLLINPKAGSQNDTVVAARHFTATVDVMEFLCNSNLHIHEAILENTKVNFYIAADGTTNLTDIFETAPDTIEEVDTTAFSLPFNALQVDGLRLQADYITFLDDKDTISASLGETELSARAESWSDMLIVLDAKDVCAKLQNETYADSLHLELIAPLAMNLDSMHFAFDGARLAVNDFNLRIEGDVTLGDDISIDASIETGKWQIKPLLALVPAKFTTSLSDLDVDGVLQLKADVKGTYSDTSMPLVTANLTLDNGEGSYKPLPYTLRDLALDADAVLNLNEGTQSTATINKLSAKTKNSQLSIVNSQLSDLLGNMLLDLHLKLDANLPDFAYFLPADMTLKGRAKGSANAKIRLEDLTEMRLEKGNIDADIDLTDIHYSMDSMIADLPNTHAVLQLPNRQPSKPKVNWVSLDLTTDRIDFVMATPLRAALKKSSIHLEAGNVLSNSPFIYAAVGLKTDRPLEVEMDSMGGTLDAPKLTAYAEYNTRDTVGLHLAEADIKCDALDGFFDDIKADMHDTQLKAFVSAGKQLKAQLQTKALNARMGETLQAKVATLALEAGSRYNSRADNALLKWNPRLKINLKKGEFNLPESLPEPVYVPSIEFSYSNRQMTIDNSRIELGNSDINLKGQVKNIGRWLRKQAILEGQLDIVSDHCDANQLMAWFSADSGSEEEPTSSDQSDASDKSDSSDSSDKSESEPFLVPTDVDLALNTHMREVEIFNQNAKDLKGGLYIKDGTLILDEMGFVCRAAKLQLTAMYRTPRRNHIYLGFDYHMLDVDIDELLSIIPDLEQMVPMLSSFKGAAEFHLAAETYLNSQYQPKLSTLRGAASLTGKDLVGFNKKTENRIDSINAEMTIYKNEIDIYPLCVQMDNYMVALGGRHNTDMTFNYDINALSPIYLGVNVSGNLDNLKIKLAKCKFAKDFRPHWYQKADTQSLELRQRIKQSMEKNVRIQ